MKALLDTHALLWAVLGPARLSVVARTVVADETNQIFVSSASAWEIATKVRLGKLPIAEQFESSFHDAIAAAGYTLLAINAAEALRAGRLVGPHGDPFDRMIAAQALGGDMPVISKDERLDGFGVRRIW